MSEESTLDICDDKEIEKFLEDHELKVWDFFGPDEYYADCPYCNYAFLYVCTHPTIEDSNENKSSKLHCYCNKCQITGPLKSIRANVTYTPPQGIKRFIYECQCFYNNNVAVVAISSISKIKNFPSMELLSKIGIKSLDDTVLKEFCGFLGYTTREKILHFNKNANVGISQKLPYKIPKDTHGLLLPFGPRPGYHVGFMVIYEGIDDVEMYTVRDTFYKANGRDNYIFFNYIINYEWHDYDTIKQGAIAFLDRKVEENGKEWGVMVLVTDYLEHIDPENQVRKVVKNRFGQEAFDRHIKKPIEELSTKKTKAVKPTPKQKQSKQKD